MQIKINQFLTEDSKVVDQINLNERTLLISAMKTGKSTLMKGLLKNKITKANLVPIYVVPQLTLMESLIDDTMVRVDGNNASIYNVNKSYITTADSLYKVVAMLKENNRKGFIMYDEVHRSVEGYSFRKKLFAPLSINDECITGILGLTATPNAIKNLDWNKTIEVEANVKFQQSKVCTLIKGAINDENIINEVLKIAKGGNKLIIRLNDKVAIERISAKLSTIVGGNNINSIYRTDDEVKAIEMNDKLTNLINNNEIKEQIIFTTSLMDCGVEIKVKDLNVLEVKSQHSTSDELVQFAGRFREGLETLTILYNYNTPTEAPVSASEAREALYDIAKACQKINVKTEWIENDEICIPAIENSLYLREQKETDFQVLLKETSTFNVGEYAYREVSTDELKAIKDQFADEDKMIAEIAKQRKENHKEAVANISAFVEGADAQQLQALMSKADMAQYAPIREEFIEVYEYLHSEHCKALRKAYYEVVDKYYADVVLDVEVETHRAIIKFILDEKNLNQLTKIENAVEANLVINAVNKEYKTLTLNIIKKGLSGSSKHITTQAMIRATVIELFGKERKIRLGKTNAEKLLKVLVDRKLIKKNTSIDGLESTLALIYNIVEDRNEISSLVTKVDISQIIK